MGKHAPDSFSAIYNGYLYSLRDRWSFQQSCEITAVLQAIVSCCSPVAVTFVGINGIMERANVGEGVARRGLAALHQEGVLRWFWVDDPLTHERRARMIVSPHVYYIKESLRGEALALWNAASDQPISIWAKALGSTRSRGNASLKGEYKEEETQMTPSNVVLKGYYPETLPRDQTRRITQIPNQIHHPDPQPDSSTNLNHTAASPPNRISASVDTVSASSALSSDSTISDSENSDSQFSSAAKKQAPVTPTPPSSAPPPPSISPARRDLLITQVAALGTNRRQAEAYVTELGEYIQAGISAMYKSNRPVQSKVGYVLQAARAARAAAERPAAQPAAQPADVVESYDDFIRRVNADMFKAGD